MSAHDDTPPALQKYPRTPHLTGSGLQTGDDAGAVLAPKAMAEAAGAKGRLVYEEKIDGANCAFRFDRGGRPFVQSRGHYLALDDPHAGRERQFALLKLWLTVQAAALFARFGTRYLVYGEWLAVVHTEFYDRLPFYLLEFDVLDTTSGAFLDTPSRRDLCHGLGFASVPVLAQSPAKQVLSVKEMTALIGPSVFRSPGERWIDGLRRACRLVGDDFGRRLAKTDRSGLAEGLYVKAERDGQVIARAKFVRPGFVQTLLDADEHWQSRFQVPNLLDHPVDAFPAHLARLQTPATLAYDPDLPLPWRDAAATETGAGGP